MEKTQTIAGIVTLMLISGCMSMPTGPSVMALPGSGASFEQFRSDDLYCRDFALRQIGGHSPSLEAAGSAVTSTAVGTGVGAAAGAAFGGGSGAAIGAGTGLLAGTLFGSAAANETYYGAQYSYDSNYVQCMYAKGHRVPVYGNFTEDYYRSGTSDSRGPSNPPDTRENATIPPPPPGQPPPPPPGATAPD